MTLPLLREDALIVDHSPGTPPHVPIGLIFTVALRPGVMVVDEHGNPLSGPVSAELDLDAVERVADELDDYLQRNGRRRR